MQDLRTTITTVLPRHLKRRLMAELALQELPFTRWLEQQAVLWLATVRPHNESGIYTQEKEHADRN
jgi:hypothetical protein